MYYLKIAKLIVTALEVKVFSEVNEIIEALIIMAHCITFCHQVWVITIQESVKIYTVKSKCLNSLWIS